MQPYEVVGHGIVYFTMAYCSMNWWHYRSIRKHIEKIQKEEGLGSENKNTDSKKK